MAGIAPSTSGYDAPDINPHTKENTDFAQDNVDKNMLTKNTETWNKTQMNVVNTAAKMPELVKTS